MCERKREIVSGREEKPAMTSSKDEARGTINGEEEPATFAREREI
jgi:hypothetical protein